MIKRALIVEGGGMRGAHTAGVLTQLSQHFRIDDFSVVCGSSAGSCTAAYWVAEQPHLFERIWGEYLHGSRFIRYRHLFTKQPVMDLNYLLDEVFTRHEPLDTRIIQKSVIKFFITATDCQSGQAHYFENTPETDILGALKAGAAIPLAYPLPVLCHDGIYADGGISDSIPIKKAMDEDCDEFWVLLTRERGYRKKALSKWPWPRWYFRHYPGLAEAMMNRHVVYNRQIELVEDLEAQGRAHVIRPSLHKTSRMTRDRQKILAAIQQGREDAAAHFKHLSHLFDLKRNFQ